MTSRTLTAQYKGRCARGLFVLGGTVGGHLRSFTVLMSLERLKHGAAWRGIVSGLWQCQPSKRSPGHETVDRQLVHEPPNKVKTAYDSGGSLPERKRMMQH